MTVASGAVRLIVLALIGIGVAGTAAAQPIGREPYNYRGTTPSGMSLGYRQAMLQYYATGATPDQLVRAPDGSLLSVERGRGQSAFVSTPGGSFLPGYRTFGFGSMAFLGGAGAGVFNPYFSSAGGQGTAVWGGYPAGGNWSYLAALASYGFGGAGPDGSTAPPYVVAGGSTPIDAWIRQLDSL